MVARLMIVREQLGTFHEKNKMNAIGTMVCSCTAIIAISFIKSISSMENDKNPKNLGLQVAPRDKWVEMSY